MVVTEIPVICTPIFRPAVPQSVLESFGENVKLLDVTAGQKVKVDILIGLDVYWKFMTPEMVCLPDGLVAQRSLFGWVLSGPLPAITPAGGVSNEVSHQLFCMNVPESSLTNFWNLESVGINDREEVPSVDPVLSDFNNRIQFSDGRYVVSLPWKHESVRPKLLNNEKLTQSCLEHLTHRLAKNPDLEAKYHEVFCEMEKEGFIEEVPSGELKSPNPVFYMPHRPVVKESSLTTKIRPVFDASARGFNGVSLNDCLNTGPSMIPNLPGILMRFRRWKVALSADVTKAFLQIGVCREDQDVHRFLWSDENVVRKMRFVRVPFGNKSSPFLLNATVKHHLSKFSPSRVVDELCENMYVDDWLSGCDDHSEACDMLNKANVIMGQAGMSLAKWGSNSEQVGNLLCMEFQDKLMGEESHKVLGMKWMVSPDYFSFDGVTVPANLCVTKRVVLSFVSRLFDPLDFLVPFVMVVKCLFQELWRLGVSWDEVIPVDIHERFTQWLDDLGCLRTWVIPRSYTGVPWRDIEVLQLHAFGDASQSAYGVCVYLRIQLKDGTWMSSLVIARAKVAPLKRG